MFKGSITALVTPFRNGKVDEATFTRFIDWQIAEGTNGLVPVGTTGESPTLDHEEHKRVIELSVKAAKKRVPVIAGTGSNSTDEAVELSQFAEKAGADAVLVVTPYYNKPSQEGLYRHFKAINDAIGIPIIIYNIPSRSVVDMSVQTMARCYELKNVAGVKDATANLARPSQTRAALGPDFCQLSGEDATALGFMAHGGAGCISVASNVAPRLCARFPEGLPCRRFQKGVGVARPAGTAARGFVRRDESGPRQVCRVAPGLRHRGDASADGRHFRRDAKSCRPGAPRSRSDRRKSCRVIAAGEY